MKKAILVFAIVTASAVNANAQDDRVQPTTVYVAAPVERFSMGVKAGLNHSGTFNRSGNGFVTDGKFGFVAGGFLSIPIVPFIGFQPEVLFSQKGFHATGQILGSRYEFTRTLNYIDIPLFFAFKPTRLVTILGGPQYSYLLKQKDVFANATTTILQEKEFVNDNLRKNTLSLVAGVDLNGKNVVFGVRGGIDVQDNNTNGSSTTPHYKNAWYQATLGFRLSY